MEAQRPQVRAPDKSFRYPPAGKYDDTPPQYNRPIFAQDLKQPRDKEFMSTEMSMKRPAMHVSPEGYEYAKSPIVHVSPERYAKSSVGNFRPMCSGFPREEEYAHRTGLVREASPWNKRQKMERLSIPSLNPAIASHDGAKVIDLCSGDQDIPDEQSDADPKVDEQTSTPHNATHDQDMNDEISMAQILTSLQGGKFAVSNI